MRPYPAYKDSGVEWLGEVPEGWEVTSIKRIGTVVNGYPFDSAQFDASEGLPLLRIRDLNKSETETRYKGDPVETAFVTSADVLIGMDGDFNVGRWLGDSPALLNQRMCCVRTPSVHLTRFVEYFLPDPLKRINDWTYATTVKHLSSLQVEKLRLALPPSTAEIAKIVGFLDKEVAKIDALVAEQRRLIALLAEKRQAVISHAVTKGLNPATPLKPSGIDWLGDIPEGWDAGKLGCWAILQGGYAFASELFGSEGVPIIKMTNLSRGKIDLTEAARIPEDKCVDKVALEQGDLLWGMSGSIGETGSLGNYGRVGSENLPCQLNQRVGRFVVNRPGLSSDFLELVIQSRNFYEQILLLVTGTAQFNVSSEQVQSVKISLPPLAEQIEIVRSVRNLLEQLDALTAAATSAISLLQERRAALISAAVTGKIDLRPHFAQSLSEPEIA